MNSCRVRRSISGLERDISNCEALVSKVINAKADKLKSTTYKPVHNVGTSSVRERSVIPFDTGPSEKVPFPPKRSNPHKDDTQPSNPANRVLCEEVVENNATIEVTVKTKAADVRKSRKRPRSKTLIYVPETDRLVTAGEIQMQSSVLSEPPDPSKFNRNVKHKKKRHTQSKHKSLSWAQILNNNTSSITHNVKRKGRDEVNKKELHAKSRRSKHNLKCAHKYLATDDLLSSSVSGDSSNDQESVHYADRSVHCSLHVDKQNMSPSKLTSKYNSSSVDGNYSIFSPVRTLNFLVKELRGKFQKSDDNMQRIITDMEHALMRIPLESNARDMDHTSDIPTRDKTSTIRPSHIGLVPLKAAAVSFSKPSVISKVTYRERGSFTEFESHAPLLCEEQKNLMDCESSKPVEPVKEMISETQIAQRELEHTCARLEVTCKKLELTCSQLRNERDSLNEKLTSEKEKLEVLSKNEKDYLTTIRGLRLNLENVMKKAEEQATAITKLAASNVQLKEENKGLLPLRDTEAVLARHLEECNEEKNRISTWLQIMKLEREKFEILMASKDRELEELKQKLRDIKAIAAEQLLNVKSFNTIHNVNHSDEGIRHAGKQSPFSSDSEIDSLATEITLFLDKAEAGQGEGMKQPVCSSPTSSLLSSLGIYPSWQRISQISSSHEDINKVSLKEMHVLSPAKKNNRKDDFDVEGNGSFPLIKPESSEFKSFLLTSLSENVIAESRSELNTFEPKTCKELKDELRSLFEKIKKQTRMGTGIILPSPPHQYLEMSEPSGMSLWSEVSDVDTIQNSLFSPNSSIELNKRKSDSSSSDISSEIKCEADS